MAKLATTKFQFCRALDSLLRADPDIRAHYIVIRRDIRLNIYLTNVTIISHQERALLMLNWFVQQY